MAQPRAGRVIRASGRLVVNPLDSFAEGTFPYGGTLVGMANLVALRPLAQAYRVIYEALDEVGDVIEGGSQWVLSCFLRGWDNEAVARFLSRGYAQGEQTQHAVYSSPGGQQPGTSSLPHAVSLAFIPDDPVNVPGIIAYRAIPDWQDGSELAFRRGSELGLPMTFELVRDDAGRILQVGRIHDLEVP